SDALLSEPTIVARMARATLGERSTVDWEGLVADYDRIRERIERVIPGFEDYNRRVREPGGFVLPNLALDRREYTTTTGKANCPIHPSHPARLEPGELRMITMRSHAQFHTPAYGLGHRNRGIYTERRVVLMNEADTRELRRAPGQGVDLASNFGGK